MPLSLKVPQSMSEFRRPRIPNTAQRPGIKAANIRKKNSMRLDGAVKSALDKKLHLRN